VLDAHRGAITLGFSLQQVTEIADAVVGHSRTR
jgi:hypothetical protein